MPVVPFHSAIKNWSAVPGAKSDAAAKHNQMMVDRIKGVQAQPSTPETDNDPRNPNVPVRD